jgi:hypothetical protein
MMFDHVTISNDQPFAQEIVTVYAIVVRWIRGGFWDRLLETLHDGCGRGQEWIRLVWADGGYPGRRSSRRKVFWPFSSTSSNASLGVPDSTSGSSVEVVDRTIT